MLIFFQDVQGTEYKFLSYSDDRKCDTEIFAQEISVLGISLISTAADDVFHTEKEIG